MDTMGTVTSLLREIRDGSKNAESRLFEHVYDDLREIAREVLGNRRQGDLQATALVHAAYERIRKKEPIDANDRRQFFFILSRAMHDVLVEQVRWERAAKRGGGARREAFVEISIDDTKRRIEILDLHEALSELGAVDPEAAQVAIFRFYWDKSFQDTSDTMDATFAKTRRHWDYAKAWLHDRLSQESLPDGRSSE